MLGWDLDYHFEAVGVKGAAVTLEEGALGAAVLDDPACEGPGRDSELHSHFFLIFWHATHAAPGLSLA